MINIPVLKGFEYERFTTYNDIKNYVTETSADVHEMGLSSDGHMIYGLSWGDLSNPMIFIDGTIHGMEWQTLHWTKEFMELIINPPNDSVYRPFIEQLKAKYCFFSIPMLNPYGYLNDSRTNANGVDLNRNFPPNWHNFPDEAGTVRWKGSAPLSEPEAQIVAQMFDDYKIIGYISTHRLGASEKARVESPGSDKGFNELLRDFCESAKVSLDKYDIEFSERTSTIIPFSVEYGSLQDSKSGLNAISCIWESPSNTDLYTHAQIGMTGLLLFCMYVDMYVTKRKLTI